jgi:hypothetical protein
MQKFLIAGNFFNKYNKLGMIYFNRVFKLYQSHLLKDSFGKVLNNTQSYYFKKDFAKLKKIVRSYKSMFFFFSYIDKLFRHIPMYPFKFFNRKSMKYQVKIYCLYFVFRPY